MQGLMMDAPLLISSLIRHADRYHGDTEIVSRLVEGGGIHRYTYRDAHSRARRLANALTSLGIRMHDRVATLAWNGFPPFRGLLRGGGHGRGVAHDQSPPVSRADRLHSQPCRRQVRFRRPDLRPAGRGDRGQVPAREGLDLHDRQGAHAADEAGERALLRRTRRPPIPTATTGRISTNARRLRCATPRARPATPRACSTAIAAPSSTATRRACRTR